MELLDDIPKRIECFRGVKVLRPKWWGMKNILEAGGWITSSYSLTDRL